MQTQRKKVFILSTGGTIGMRPGKAGYEPCAGFLAETMAKLPELHNADMPLYTLEEYDHPIDSANVTIEHWRQMAESILAHYHDYDGFVILHGTDTMAYTASALSFMLENLDKPVILTGSQLPLCETRNDARENLIHAMLLAGNYSIPEVCVYFRNKLFRGNRVRKVDANHFAAFDSANFPALAQIGTEITLRRSLLRTKSGNGLRIQALQPACITVLRLFPGMSIEWLRHSLRAPLQALVLETYGLGNAPQDPAFLALISDVVAKGLVIVNCSQCVTAKVRMQSYAAGSALAERGVISAGDMTVEAALAKLFYLFSLSLSLPQIKTLFVENMRGELTL